MFTKLKINNFQKIRMLHSCQLLVVGGGAGGIYVAAKLKRKIKDIIILEPSDKHYYQPLFTFVGAGIKTLNQSWKKTRKIIPKGTKWLQCRAALFEPNKNTVLTTKGDIIKYEYMVIAIGVELHYEKIPGLEEALSMPEKDSMVSSNYSPKYVERTFKCLKLFERGNLFFIYPNTPVKCSGATQKCMYIADDYLRKNSKRDEAHLIHNSANNVLFPAKKYADALWKICKKRNLEVNLKRNLIEIKPDKKIAIFEDLDKPKEKIISEYSFMNVTPPMYTPRCLQTNRDLANDTGYLTIDKLTLRHTKYENIFGIGDCTDLPTSKTGAAVGPQSKIVAQNILSVMKNEKPNMVYNGYTSCPLVTSYNTIIMAEFDYDLKPLETFYYSQDQESYLMFFLVKEILPLLYWNLGINGYWSGSSTLRKIMNPFNRK